MSKAQHINIGTIMHSGSSSGALTERLVELLDDSDSEVIIFGSVGSCIELCCEEIEMDNPVALKPQRDFGKRGKKGKTKKDWQR